MQKEAIDTLLILLFLAAGANILLGQNQQDSSQVVEVVDGDTVDIIQNSERDTVRILGIDTPEVRGENIPAEYFLENTSRNRECLIEIGEKASNLAREQVEGENVEVVTDPQSDRRGSYGRLLAYIEYKNTDLGQEMLEKGYARVYNSSFSRIEEYRAIERESREKGKGIWNESCGA
jgi:micrococcal nuclease